MHDSKEAEYPAKSSVAFHAAVAEPEGDEETPRPCTRVDQQAAKREGSEADHRGTDARASRLGDYFRTGNADREFNKMDYFVVKSLRRWQYRRGGQRPTKRAPFTGDQLYGMGLHKIDGHREIPGASRTKKIIVKPCAGKRHARFERGN